MRLISLCLVLALAFESAVSYKVLVYNVRFGHSHSNYMGNIADILADAGNNVTSLVSIIDPNGKDVTTKSNMIYVQQTEETKQINDAMASRKADFFTMDVFDLKSTYFVSKVMGGMFAAQCKGVLEEPGLIERLAAEKFDIYIVENFDMCGAGLAHVIKPKSFITSGASSPFSRMYAEFGIPLSLSYNPSSYMSYLDVHSFMSRLKNIYADFLMQLFFWPGRYLVEDVFRAKYGQDYPSMEEICSHSAYTLVNAEPLIDFATPTLNRVIPIGGIGAKPPQPLDKHWNDVLSLKKKTVLLSFGSVAKSMFLPQQVKESIVKAIGEFPDVTFIWKYEEPDSEFGLAAQKKLPNLVMSKWTPQNDLLNDTRITAFITHGGMGSTQETALRGVPGIFIPIFGDQPRNAGMMQHNGFGKVLDKLDLFDSAKLIAAIRDVLTNDSYRKNARRVSAMLAKKPFTARQQLIKYIEFAAEFGPSPALRPQSHDMSFIEYHNLDVLAAFVVASIVSIVITLKVSCKLISLCFGVKKVKKE